MTAPLFTRCLEDRKAEAQRVRRRELLVELLSVAVAIGFFLLAMALL